MPSNKEGRLNEDVKRVVIEIIREMKDPRVQGFLTVTRAVVTPDLSNAKVYISMIDKDGGETATENAVKALNKAAGHIRTEISRRMHIRKSPEFLFIKDSGAAYATHINKVLEDLK